jgi:hypothetical protein
VRLDGDRVCEDTKHAHGVESGGPSLALASSVL